MTFGLVDIDYSLPEGQVVKLIFFAPCQRQKQKLHQYAKQTQLTLWLPNNFWKDYTSHIKVAPEFKIITNKRLLTIFPIETCVGKMPF